MPEAAWSTGRATTPPPGKGCLPLRCLPLPISPSLHSHFDPLRPPAGCDTGALGVGRIIIARTVWAQVPKATTAQAGKSCLVRWVQGPVPPNGSNRGANVHQPELNPGRWAHETIALTTELRGHNF